MSALSDALSKSADSSDEGPADEDALRLQCAKGIIRAIKDGDAVAYLKHKDRLDTLGSGDDEPDEDDEEGKY